MARAVRNPALTIGALVVLILVAVVALSTCGDDDAEEATPTNTATASATASPSVTPSPSVAPSDRPSEQPPTDPPTADPGPTDPPGNGGNGAPPADVSLLTPVDKQHALPPDYVPPDLVAIPGAYLAPGFGGSLRVEARDALVHMLDEAFAAGHDIGARSAYRSYSEQQTTFQYWVDTLGYDEAVRVSAMPGHSEHQLGTAADVTTAEVGWELTESLGNTGAGQWLAANAHLYGFALSYPAGAEGITGYAYEPWHFRYIGLAEAAAWKASGLTLNVYLLQ